MPTMDPRYNNTGIAVSMGNLIKAFQPDAATDQNVANTRYLNARADGQLISNKAQESLGAAVSQLMNVNDQPMPVIPAAATPGGMQGMPAAIPAMPPPDRSTAIGNLATSYLQGGMAPGSLGSVFLALTGNDPNTDANTVTRALVGAGKPLGKDDAISMDRQNQMRQQNQDWAIQQELAQPRVVGPGDGLASAMGYYVQPDAEVYADARGESKDYMVKPDDMNAINAHIDQRFGIQVDKDGKMIDGSAPDLSPSTRLMLGNKAAALMREGKMDFVKATELAIQEITGGKPLEVQGEPEGVFGIGEDTREQALPQRQPAAASMTATNPQTGERIISRDGGQTWSKM